MKTKKTLLALLALGVLSASAFAEPSIESIADKQVTVSCDATTGESVALTVARKDHPASQTEWVVAVKESVAKDGKAVFKFNMPDTLNDEIVDGEYVAYTKVNGQAKEKTTFLYVAPETRDSLKEAFQNIATKEELSAIFNNPENDLALRYMGYDMESYNALPGADAEIDYKDATIQAMFDAVGDFGTAGDEDKANSFEESLVLNYINSFVENDSLESAIGNLTFEDVAYDNIEETELKDWINLCMLNHKPYEDYDSILKEYKTSNILHKLNNARFSSIKDLLTKYASDLGISENEVYNKYKEVADDGTVNEAIASRLTSAKPQTVALLMAEIETAIKPTADKPASSGGGGGGGGGGTTGNYAGGPESKPDLVLPVDRKPIEETITFGDVEDDFWGKTAIDELVKNKIVSGDGNGRFRPNDTVTREEFVKMVVSIIGDIDEKATCEFRDVVKGDWCYKYVANAVNKGIIYGKDENNFGRGEGLTRQDMAVICMRVAEGKVAKMREDVVFADESSISSYAKDAVHKLYCAGVVSGTGDDIFAPSAFATRAQAAQILYKIFYN